VNTLMVLVRPAEKGKIEEYGSPDQFLPTLAPLLGKQSWQGDSGSEGGFERGKVSVANVLTTGSAERGGKTYYEYEILTRTADGDEGGRHHLFTATVANGKLYICKGQAGDKRWFKGLEKDLKKTRDSFVVA
jgi:photosystem II oxygen-evolving enhancer protein 2